MILPSRYPFIRIINEVLRIHGRTRAVFSAVETETGLGVLELSVLSFVAEARTPFTVAALGLSLGYPRQVIQRAANALVEQGLLRMEDNPHHKRAKVLATTCDGRELKARADARAEEIAREMVRTLSAEACDEIVAQLRLVRMDMDRYIARKDK